MTWKQLPAIWETPLRPTDKLVLLCLAQFGNQQGKQSRPSQATISRLTGVSQRSVRYALSRLKDAGLIEAHGKGPKGTIKYQINLPIRQRRSATGAYQVGNGLPTIQLKNPSNSQGDSNFNQGPAIQVDRFSTLDIRTGSGAMMSHKFANRRR
jgi:DNA-binding transcriptional ArsR family regulator